MKALLFGDPGIEGRPYCGRQNGIPSMDVAQPTELEVLRGRIAELEQKLSDHDAQHSEEHFKRQWRIVDTALAHTPDSTYIFDRHGRLVYANKTLLNLWGKPLHQVVGKAFHELGYPPEVAEKVSVQIQEVLQTRQPVRDQVSLSVFTGHPRQYEYIFVPVFTADGTVEAIAGSTRDITERHESRAALESANTELLHARRQLVAIFESMTDAFFALDNDWRFTYVNHQAEKVLFRPRAELVGKDIWAEFAPAVGSTFYHEYHRAKAENIPVNFEEFYPPLATWFEVRAFPSPDGLGVYFHNINERKAAQEAMERQAAELARINADLENFAYAAAHDLQEPLRMVSIFTQLLEKKYASHLDTEAGKYIAYAVDGARRMERLVHDLLAYTRATSSGESARDPVNAEAVLQKVLTGLRSTIEASGTLVSHSALPFVLIGEVHLQQLFQNLIGNAIKYRRKDVPRIHISAEKVDCTWRFAVEDNGIGLEREYAEQVFGLFKRLHTKDQYEGTGIGLAICQKIVHRYGGQIWVKSTLGRGSTFFFTLPI